MKQKNIIIIGGGSSIGKGIIENLDLNYHNIVILTSQKDLIIKNNNVKIIYSNLKNQKEIEKISNQILTYFNKIDVLFFNHGGGLGIHDSFISFKLLNKLLWHNLGIFQEFINNLIDHFEKDARIICVGSVASKQVTASIGYTISKASLENYVRLLSKILIPKNIHIIGLSMGAFWAENNAMDRLKINKPNIYKKYIEDKLPRKKMGVVSEIVPMVIFLFFQEVGMLSGSIIPMDGGEKTSL